MSEAMPESKVIGAITLSEETLARLVCPVCRSGLTLDMEMVVCGQCGRRYPVQDGIPVLIAERALGSDDR